MFGILTLGTGSFDVSDNGLMNTMLGPELSRPLVQSLHACVAIGFVMGNVLEFVLKKIFVKIFKIVTNIILPLILRMYQYHDDMPQSVHVEKRKIYSH